MPTATHDAIEVYDLIVNAIAKVECASMACAMLAGSDPVNTVLTSALDDFVKVKRRFMAVIEALKEPDEAA